MIRDNLAKEREAKYICLSKAMHFLNVADLGTNKNGPNSLCALSVSLIDLVLFPDVLQSQLIPDLSSEL